MAELPSTRTENAEDRLSAMIATVDALRGSLGPNDGASMFLDGVACGIEAAAAVAGLTIVTWFTDDPRRQPISANTSRDGEGTE